MVRRENRFPGILQPPPKRDRATHDERLLTEPAVQTLPSRGPPSRTHRRGSGTHGGRAAKPVLCPSAQRQLSNRNLPQPRHGHRHDDLHRRSHPTGNLLTGSGGCKYGPRESFEGVRLSRRYTPVEETGRDRSLLAGPLQDNPPSTRDKLPEHRPLSLRRKLPPRYCSDNLGSSRLWPE